MKWKVPIGRTLLLIVMSLVPLNQSEKCPEYTSPVKDLQSGLKCNSDGMDVITCEWNSSSLGDVLNMTTNCFLHAFFYDYIDCHHRQSELVPLNSPHQILRTATLKFIDVSLENGRHWLPLYVFCGKESTPVDKISKFKPVDHIKTHPPLKPEVVEANLTWTVNLRHPSILNDEIWKFEVQWKEQQQQNWKRLGPLQENQIDLSTVGLDLGKVYMFRVRALPTSLTSGIWSDWSPITEWKSTVGSSPPGLGELFFGSLMSLTSLVILVSAVLILLAFFCIHRFKSFLKYSFIPKPTKYFDELLSKHGGDFKSWLGPVVSSELYFKPDPECVSSVLVFEISDCDKSLRKSENFYPTDKKDGNTSNFSNSTYFLSQSSKCAMVDQLEPCSMDCPYGPTKGTNEQEKVAPDTYDDRKDDESESSIGSPLEMFSSNRKFRLDVQSPDSGFVAGNEDQESQDESGSEGLPSPPVVGITLSNSHILQCPQPQMPRFPNPMFLPGFSCSPWTNPAMTNLVQGVSTDLLTRKPDFSLCSGILEPSGDDYLPVKKVQE